MSQSENPVSRTERAVSDCVFCKIADRGEAVAYENEYIFVRFDKFPVSSGHSLIIPKRHGCRCLTSKQTNGLPCRMP